MHVTAHAASEDGPLTLEDLVARAEIVDALYRFALGQDLHDSELFASAFAEDAVLDFRPAAEKLGLRSALMVSRETITSTIIPMFFRRVDTTHTVTNPRVVLRGDIAWLTAHVEAQHLLSADHTRFALLKNLYDVTLSRKAYRWVITNLTIHNVWFRGDPQAIFGG